MKPTAVKPQARKSNFHALLIKIETNGNWLPIDGPTLDMRTAQVLMDLEIINPFSRGLNMGVTMTEHGKALLVALDQII